VSGKSGELPFVRSTPLGVEPFPIVLNKSVQVYVDRYLSSPKGLEGSFKRSSPYMPEMVSLLRDRGLPPDLVYLTFAESEFSKDGAGPWQLSRETARRFGLAVNNWVDERRDPVKSTRAAADYLSSLHEQTGDDWPMTLVAWNNGESGVNRYINQESSSYERLLAALPYRTRALLNRFMAVAFIAKSHRQFGFTTADPQGTAPYRTVGVPGGTPLKLVAAKTHTSLATLRGLNPGLLRGCTPPSAYSYPVRIPQGPLQTSL
jgi:membrane-bound lytic murein transglycosylase D